MKELHEKNIPIELIGVYNASKVYGNIKIAYLSSLTTVPTIATSSVLENHIDTLTTLYLKRQIQLICNKGLECIGNSNPLALKSELASQLDEISSSASPENDDIQSIISKVSEEMQTKNNNKNDNKYLYGIEELDALTGGLHKEETTTLAARPAVGKTAFALQIALNLASNGLTVLFISREMSSSQIAKRLLASITDIDSMKLKSKNLSEKEWAQILNAMNSLAKTKLFINTKIKTVSAIKSRSRQIKADIVIVDYLQLLSPENNNSARERQVAEISRELKNMSLDQKIPVIQLSQLNRNAHDKEPSLSDLRESGSIEQDSNNVIFIHKPSCEEVKYLVDNNIITTSYIAHLKANNFKLTNIILAKQRDGAIGKFLMTYIPGSLTFKKL